MRRKTQTEFIKDAIKKHGDYYDYSMVEYKNSTTPIKLLCPKHGEFLQSPKSHLKGCGCSVCGNEKMSKIRRESKGKYKRPRDIIISKDTESFISKASSLHGHVYDYSLVEYKNNRSLVTIGCLQHGNFLQRPIHHLRGQGCPHCRYPKTSQKLRMDSNVVIQRFRESHGDKYDYSLVNYKNNRTNVTIICPEHGSFQQTPETHAAGHGCPQCAESGFNTNTPAILYYLRVDGSDNEYLYKIGITNLSVSQRFIKSELDIISVIRTWYFPKGSMALDIEKEILTEFKDFQYRGVGILRSGNTELFTMDVLDLDNGVCVSTP